MSRWYTKVTTASPDKFYQVLGEAIEHYYQEHEAAQHEIRPKRGDSIMDKSRELSGITEYRFGQLQELEGMLKYLEIQYDKAKGDKKRHFYEHYNRQLSERLADQYADIEPEVIVIREFIQQVALIRNHFQAVTKGLEVLHYQITNIRALRVAGIEDATF
jgi:hypothetical protein